MDPGAWARLHGALIHFPVALPVFAAGCDTAALGCWSRPTAARLQSAGGYALYLAALGSVPAVVSGLVLTRGDMLGHDALRRHHLLVWPAWTLLIALAVWRALRREEPTRAGHAVGVAFGWLLVALMGGAGHWGGLLAQSFP